MMLNEDIIYNESGQNLCEIYIDIYDIYSPNLEDSEIIVNIKLGKLLMLFEPNTVNNIIKFFPQCQI